MTNTPSSRGKNAALLIAGILMIATTLRVTFTGAAPLLDAIRADYGLSTAQTGLLTTLPLLAFALVSPLAAAVARRWGIERSLFVAIARVLRYVRCPHQGSCLAAPRSLVAESHWEMCFYPD